MRMNLLDPQATTTWDVVIDGLVTAPTRWSVSDVRSMVSELRSWDTSGADPAAADSAWEGVPAGRLIEATRPLPEARFVKASSQDGGQVRYYTLKRARRCLLAWRLDGADLSADRGGPLRLVAPPVSGRCDGVRRLSHLTLTSEAH